MQDEGKFGDRRDWIKGGPVHAPDGHRFVVVARVDRKHGPGSNSWPGMHNAQSGVDYHPIRPAIITDVINEVGLIYCLKRELKT